jgi:hypothetical protein
MPHTSSKDLAIIAALELSNALQKPAPAEPFSHIGTVQLQELCQLSEIFQADLPSTTAKHAPPVAQTSTVPPFAKLLPLPQPSLRAHTDERTNPSAQRATQLRSVLARVYAVSRQNQITTNVP